MLDRIGTGSDRTEELRYSVKAARIPRRTKGETQNQVPPTEVSGEIKENRKQETWVETPVSRRKNGELSFEAETVLRHRASIFLTVMGKKVRTCFRGSVGPRVKNGGVDRREREKVPNSEAAKEESGR